MATLTKSLLPISGYTNQYYTYQCTVTENSYSVANNTSNVTIIFSIKGPWSPSFYEWATYYGIVVDGSVKKTGNSSPYINTNYTSLLTWTGDIAHNSDGSKSINVGVYLYQNGPANYLPKQYTSSSPLSMGSVTLTTIPRASSLSLSTTSLYVGDSITANISRASSNFTHTVEFYINNSYYQKYTNVGTAQSFTIPSSWYAAMPSSLSCNAYCRITTYNGSTQVGGQTTKSFVVNVQNNIVPSIGTITLDPINITTKDGTSRNILVQGKNKITVSVSGCAAGTGSSIKSYTFSGPGISATTTGMSVTSSDVISNTGTLTYTVKVTDSRGRTASKTANITCYAYTAPYIRPFKVYRCNSSGTEDNGGAYVKCDYTIGYSDVNSTNNVTVKIMYKKNTASNYSSVTSLTNSTAKSGSKIISSIDTASTYTIYATIEDQYGSSSQSSVETIFSVSRVFNITPDGTGIAFGKMAENTNLIDSKWPIRTDSPEKTMKNLTYKGTNIINKTADDTTTNWGNLGNLATSFYNSTGQITNQPSQYGFVLNLTNGPDSKEVHQIWATQSSGSLAHRGGNSSGWNGTWRTILDSSNYSSYITMPADYIVEEVINNDFKYRKWNSGLSELWYYKYHGEIEMTTSMADNVYSNSTYTGVSVTLPSGVFLTDTIPMAQGNVYSNGYTCCQVCSADSSKFSYRIWSPYSTTITACRVSVYMTGVWK